MDNRLYSYINWGLLACMMLLYLVGVGNLYSASGTRVESGLAFNSILQLESEGGIPRNPFINAGAVVTTELQP